MLSTLLKEEAGRGAEADRCQYRGELAPAAPADVPDVAPLRRPSRDVPGRTPPPQRAPPRSQVQAPPAAVAAPIWAKGRNRPEEALQP